MPSDNPSAITGGSAIEFPNDGETNGVITRDSTTIFNLPTIGTYRVSFHTTITGDGQLVVGLNSGSGVVQQAKTVVGITNVQDTITFNNQLNNTCLIRTTTTNSKLTVRNPAGNASITLTASAGGTQPISAGLLIERIA